MLVDQNNARENLRRIDFDRKAEDKNVGPYVITQVHTNGTVRIQRGNISERLNIRRLIPFKEYIATQSVSNREIQNLFPV